MLNQEFVERVINYKPDTINNQKTYKGQMRLNIYVDYLNGMRKSKIAVKYGLSNSRIDQIINGMKKLAKKFEKN